MQARYINIQALSDERVQLTATGQVALKLKTPWREGATHLVMSPVEFMQRLAALMSVCLQPVTFDLSIGTTDPFIVSPAFCLATFRPGRHQSLARPGS